MGILPHFCHGAVTGSYLSSQSLTYLNNSASICWAPLMLGSTLDTGNTSGNKAKSVPDQTRETKNGSTCQQEKIWEERKARWRDRQLGWGVQFPLGRLTKVFLKRFGLRRELKDLKSPVWILEALRPVVGTRLIFLWVYQGHCIQNVGSKAEGGRRWSRVGA